MIYSYPCDLALDEGGALVVTFPDVPEAITGGTDRVEALDMAADALAAALAGYVHEKRDIPHPSEAADGQNRVAVPTVVAAKLALDSAMRAQRITKVELALQAGCQRIRRPEADRPRPPLPHRPGPKSAPRRRPQPGDRGHTRLSGCNPLVAASRTAARGVGADQGEPRSACTAAAVLPRRSCRPLFNWFASGVVGIFDARPKRIRQLAEAELCHLKAGRRDVRRGTLAAARGDFDDADELAGQGVQHILDLILCP